MFDAIGLRWLWSWLAERRFQRIAMSLGDGLVCADRDFAITLWNPGAEALFGYRSDEILGRPFATICARAERAARSRHSPSPTCRAIG
ncbi:PAS domain S-box protein [Rhodopseudomonas sp. P2A-2r]|uniref:PAS domain S-box protein n=1 Tax=Rhodopseudomonas sp. P2A-2r TaxID=2991972 RepID=UPI002234D913|nr:PAS domain S-box protein [Rhodopseudomonas sp. P2A-2r]UZE47571.1 PAS domain S-box protein [Rhodopseudomonas sp. P2A-2r]